MTQPNDRTTRPSVTHESATTVASWFVDYRGAILWKSHDLSNPGKTWWTPQYLKAPPSKGLPCGATPPHWSAASPVTYTHPHDIDVVTGHRFKKFRVALRRGSQGLKIKLTDASTARVNKALADAARKSSHGDSWNTFDYETQEAEIFYAQKVQTLDVYIARLLDSRRQATPA